MNGQTDGRTGGRTEERIDRWMDDFYFINVPLSTRRH